MDKNKELPRGGGVVVSPNIIRTRAFVDINGNFVNNLKEKKPIAPLNDKIDVTPQEIQEAFRNRVE